MTAAPQAALAAAIGRPVHWTSADSLEALAFSRAEYTIEFGTDGGGDYGAVVTREGTEFRARLEAAIR